MKTPLSSPALFLQSERYPRLWEGKIPLRVEIIQKAYCVPIWFGKIRQPIALVGNLFDVWVDWNGCVSALFESGEELALRPHEYRIVAWHVADFATGEAYV